MAVSDRCESLPRVSSLASSPSGLSSPPQSRQLVASGSRRGDDRVDSGGGEIEVDGRGPACGPAQSPASNRPVAPLDRSRSGRGGGDQREPSGAEPPAKGRAASRWTSRGRRSGSGCRAGREPAAAVSGGSCAPGCAVSNSSMNISNCSSCRSSFSDRRPNCARFSLVSSSRRCSIWACCRSTSAFSASRSRRSSSWVVTAIAT